MKQAPVFTLPDHVGKIHQLADYAGKWVVLYFYPKDDTPGCTAEACSIRDVNSEFEEMGVEVFGISMDTPEDHATFKKKYNLPFTLLSDPMGATIRDYDAWGKKMFGREGILRKTYIIDAAGVVQKVYGRVTPTAHGEEVLKDLRQLIT